MKKLLALILCVMMFVAVIPTSAFAAANTTIDLPNDGTTQGVTTYNLEATKAVATHLADAISDVRDQIKFSYESLVGDKAVYTSIQACDTFIKDLVDAWADGFKTASVVADRNTSKDNIRNYVGSVIRTGIDAHPEKWIDSKGNSHPDKYAAYVAELISDALTDDKFIGALQKAYASRALVNFAADVDKDLKDEWEDFINSVDATLAAKVALPTGYDLNKASVHGFNYVTPETNPATTTDTSVWGLYPGGNEAGTIVIVGTDGLRP